jgi:hypothetical protein
MTRPPHCAGLRERGPPLLARIPRLESTEDLPIDPLDEFHLHESSVGEREAQPAKALFLQPGEHPKEEPRLARHHSVGNGDPGAVRHTGSEHVIGHLLMLPGGCLGS